MREYIKYNNNSGYIDEEHLRSTPQAFSHFTFHASKGAEMVVDVQGVGDLYTDPQFHTVDGEEYGEGNLGPRGMASFLGTHHCDDLCRLLGLPPFVLSPKRRREMHAGHLEHVRHVQELGGEGGEGGEGLVAIGGEGGGGGGGSSSEVSSAGGTAGGSSVHSAATAANVSSATSSKESTPAATAFKARGAMLQAGASSKLGAGRKNSSNPLLATLFRQATVTALSLIGGGGGGTSTRDAAAAAAAAAASRELPAASLASLPRWVLALGNLTAEEAERVWDLENPDVGAVHLSMVRERDSWFFSHSDLQVFALRAPLSNGDNLTSEVHFALNVIIVRANASLYSEARLDVDEDVPAVESALFHLAEAARNGDQRSLRGLYDMLRGLPQGAVPGLKLEEEADAGVAAAVLTPLAESGDCDAMMEAADAAAAAGEGARAAAWLERVEETINAAREAAATAAEGSESDVNEEDYGYGGGGGGDMGVADDDDGLPDRLTVLQKLAAVVRPTDPERSGNLFSEAAELATMQSKGKLAMKLSMLAEEAWGEMEEVEEVEEEAR